MSADVPNDPGKVDAVARKRRKTRTKAGPITDSVPSGAERHPPSDDAAARIAAEGSSEPPLQASQTATGEADAGTQAATPPAPKASVADEPPAAAAQSGELDIERFAKNIARMMEEGGKALAAYLK